MIDPKEVWAFVAEQEARPARWGSADCSTRLGDWTARVSGFDAAAPFRGRYATALGCARLLRAEGGLTAIVDRCGERQGCDRSQAADGRTYPGVGAVGVLGLRHRLFHQWGAISDGDYWIVFGWHGVDWYRVDAVAPLTSWELAPCRLSSPR